MGGAGWGDAGSSFLLLAPRPASWLCSHARTSWLYRARLLHCPTWTKHSAAGVLEPVAHACQLHVRGTCSRRWSFLELDKLEEEEALQLASGML